MPVSPELVKKFISETSMLYEMKPYSGRGSNGSKWVSLVCDNFLTALAEVTIDVFHDGDFTEAERNELRSAIKRAQVDDMGLSKVLYWPSLKWPEGFQ